MSRERDNSGRYTETATPEDVLGVFETVAGPVVTSSDVADALECSHETARRKLRTLEKQGWVASRKTAGRVVWWLAEKRGDEAAVDPADPFWEFEPGASGDSSVSERADEILYGEDSQ